MTAYRESQISEVEVVFTRLPRRHVIAPVTPTSEIPPTVLDEARRMAMPTLLDDYCDTDPEPDLDVDQDDIETERREPVDTEAFRETAPTMTAPMLSPVNPVVGSTVPMTRDVVREAEAIAATIRAARELPRVTPRAPRLEAIAYHHLRQPPPTWPPPAPIVIVPPKRAEVRVRSEKGTIVAALVIAAVSLAAGAGTLLYALAL